MWSVHIFIVFRLKLRPRRKLAPCKPRLRLKPKLRFVFDLYDEKSHVHSGPCSSRSGTAAEASARSREARCSCSRSSSQTGYARRCPSKASCSSRPGQACSTCSSSQGCCSSWFDSSLAVSFLVKQFFQPQQAARPRQELLQPMELPRQCSNHNSRMQCPRWAYHWSVLSSSPSILFLPVISPDLSSKTFETKENMIMSVGERGDSSLLFPVSRQSLYLSFSVLSHFSIVSLPVLRSVNIEYRRALITYLITSPQTTGYLSIDNTHLF